MLCDGFGITAVGRDVRDTDPLFSGCFEVYAFQPRSPLLHESKIACFHLRTSYSLHPWDDDVDPGQH